MAKTISVIEPGKKVRLNKTNIDSIVTPGIYPDDDLTGFRLWVGKGGVKSYQVVGKVKGEPRPVYITIGKHGDPWTSDAARAKAKEVRLQMQNGINPNAQKRKISDEKESARAIKADEAKVKAITLRKAFDDYIADKRETNSIKESTAYVYRCDIKKCLADWLDKPIGDIQDGDITDRHRLLSRNHPGQANHVMRVLRTVFNFAMNRYKTADRKAAVKDNPVSQLSKDSRWNKLKPRTNIIKEHQLKAFFAACQALEHPTASDYLPFLILTGLRAEEAASLPWSQVDLRGRTILVKDTKNGSDHRLPLTDYLHALLKCRWQSRSSSYVFSLDADNFMGDYRYQVKKVVAGTRQLLATSEDDEIRIDAESFNFTLHDLRRTFGTVAAMTQPGYVVKGLLNHSDKNDVTQTHYIHAELEKLRKPMQDVCNHILTCAGVTEYGAPALAPASKVVQISRPRKKASGK